MMHNSHFTAKKMKENIVNIQYRTFSIWQNRHWNRVEWTQEMVFNTCHHTRTCLDEKIEIDEKKVSKNFFLTNFLKGYFKVFSEKAFFSKKTLVRFLSKIRFSSWKIVKPLFLTEKTGKSWPRNKILWLSDDNSRKKSDVAK